MSDFKHIKNIKELQKEKGIYYPYIMQLLEAPVIDGVLVFDTCLKRYDRRFDEGIKEILLTIYNTKTGKKMFEEIDEEEFKFSMDWALADLFCGGCEPEYID